MTSGVSLSLAWSLPQASSLRASIADGEWEGE